MKNKINFNKIVDVLEKGIQIRSMSPYAQFALQCLGYEFYDGDVLIHKWELINKGYDNIEMLLNEQYPIRVVKRKEKKNESN